VDEVFPVFERYGWPGNVRELRNTVERMAILSAGDRLGEDSIPAEVRAARREETPSSLQQARETAEREHLVKALSEAEWNVSAAARALGMERTNLHKRIRALGLSRERDPRAANGRD
jgi:transcriptional regulator of acetoin/glycerol metabolism